MLNSPPANFPAAAPWSDVARVCRRVCILHERGRADETEHVRRSELPAMIAALRTPSDTDEEIAARLNSIFTAERERVANAVVLAELLAPLLQESNRSLATAEPTSIAANVPAAAATPRPSRPPARARPTGGDIADFIDEMIAQERPPDRSARPTAVPRTI